MISYVYRIGFPSGHYYIGVKKGTPESTTTYYGSPKRNKWMWDEFPVVCKEILWVTDTFKKALDVEKSVLIGLDYSQDPLNLNFNCGGHIPAMSGKDHPMFGVNRSGELNPFFGRSHSEETKNRIAEKRKGTRHTEESKSKIRENHASLTDSEWSSKMSAAFKGKPKSEAQKQWLSENRKGEKNPFFGRKHSLESLEKMHPQVKCEHCGKEMNKGNYKRWHGDNCKMKKND